MDIRILAITLEQFGVLAGMAFKTEVLADTGSISFTRLFFEGFTTTIIDTPLEAGALCIGISVAIEGVRRLLTRADNIVPFVPNMVDRGRIDPTAESDIA